LVTPHLDFWWYGWYNALIMQSFVKYNHGFHVFLGLLYLVGVIAFLGFVDLTTFPEVPAVSAYALGLFSAEFLIAYYFYSKRQASHSQES
jgi:membrane protein insertase Oxa1/YidC/SpoIIIJ